MNLRYRVELSAEERGELETLLSAGEHPVRKLKRAQILRAADAGASDEQIARTVAVSVSTVYRTKQRFVEGNLPWALSERSRPGAVRKLSGEGGSAVGGDGVCLGTHRAGSLDTRAAGGGNDEIDRARDGFPGNCASASGGK
jgi:hypothetical protein